MPALEVTGAYCGVTTLKRATNITDNTHDREILDHLVAASREIDRQTFRRYFPVTATNAYRWPQFAPQYTWELWTEDDLLSVTTLQAAATGTNAVPVTITNYFLEPQQFGPPYNRIEIDLSSTDAFQSGPTPQRSVTVLGQWGYSNRTLAIGALTALLSSTDTTLTAFTGNTLASIEPGDVLLIESEAVFVDLDPGSSSTVLRRAANGTTAAQHADTTAVAKYVAPEPIRRIVRADAIATYQQDLASWGRVVGALGMEVQATGRVVASYRDKVISEYARRRTAAV